MPESSTHDAMKSPAPTLRTASPGWILVTFFIVSVQAGFAGRRFDFPRDAGTVPRRISTAHSPSRDAGAGRSEGRLAERAGAASPVFSLAQAGAGAEFPKGAHVPLSHTEEEPRLAGGVSLLPVLLLVLLAAAAIGFSCILHVRERRSIHDPPDPPEGIRTR